MPHVYIISILIPTTIMDSVNHDYPDYLNPFDSDGDGEDANNKGKSEAINSRSANKSSEEYPDYLSPFDDDDAIKHEDSITTPELADDYDDSLNPFGDEEIDITAAKHDESIEAGLSATEAMVDDEPESREGLDEKTNVPQIKKPAVMPPPSQPEESLGPPPVPLPRTRSLLKKEQALRNRQPPGPATESNNYGNSSSISEVDSSLTTTKSLSANNEGSFQRKKNKRNAPPLPVNFKRQVSGSAEAIEEELNGIGDRLAELETESKVCQSDLKRTYQVNDTEFAIARAKFVEIIRMKNSILRRQKELMYRKREITLDQNHSDIEYELRMIGNKQSSNQTPEDDNREKELLKKLVEIVEEKSDIVENLNRDTSCDIEDVEEALRRMNLSNGFQPKPNSKQDEPSSIDVPKQKDSCYKSNNLVSVAKFSKIATLLPKGGTLKGTMKLKRKRLFNKKSSHVP